MITKKKDLRDQQTKELFRQYSLTQDPKIRDEIVLLHIDLVHYIAKGFSNNSEPIEDLIQVGIIGLINAVDRFDQNREIKFSSYATPTIVGEILRHFRNNKWVLSAPRYLKILSIVVDKAMDRMLLEDGKIDWSKLSYLLEISDEDLHEAILAGRGYRVASLDRKVLGDYDDSSMPLIDGVGENDPELENLVKNHDLHSAIAKLNPLEKRIIWYLFSQEKSQNEVGKLIGVSQMHISRLQKAILLKLGRTLEEDVNTRQTVSKTTKREMSGLPNMVNEYTDKTPNRISVNEARVLYVIGKITGKTDNNMSIIGKKAGLSTTKTILIIRRLISLKALTNKPGKLRKIANPYFFVDDIKENTLELVPGVVITKGETYNLFEILI